jgi:putative membrane protein
MSARITAAVMTVLMATSAGVASAADTGLSPGDREFINKAAAGNLMEVQAGKLAAQRGLAPAVKSFGQQMVSDHTAANESLKSLADSKQMPLTDTISPEDHTLLGKLEGLNGTEFDKTYSQMMVKDHTTDISEFEKAYKKAKDPDVKAYAQQTLPTLRHHLMMVNQLNSNESKSPAQMSGPSAEAK